MEQEAGNKCKKKSWQVNKHSIGCLIYEKTICTPQSRETECTEMIKCKSIFSIESANQNETQKIICRVLLLLYYDHCNNMRTRRQPSKFLVYMIERPFAA